MGHPRWIAEAESSAGGTACNHDHLPKRPWSDLAIPEPEARDAESEELLSRNVASRVKLAPVRKRRRRAFVQR
jgi:hypothetical protein